MHLRMQGLLPFSVAPYLPLLATQKFHLHPVCARNNLPHLTSRLEAFLIFSLVWEASRLVPPSQECHVGEHHLAIPETMALILRSILRQDCTNSGQGVFFCASRRGSLWRRKHGRKRGKRSQKTDNKRCLKQTDNSIFTTSCCEKRALKVIIEEKRRNNA